MVDTFDTSDPWAPGHYKPSETALFLLDFHGIFVQKMGGPGARAALQVASKLRDWAKSQGIAVVHALVNVKAMPFASCKGRDRFADVVQSMQEGGGHLEPAELTFNKEDDEPTFYRDPGYVSALVSHGLTDYLKKKGIKSLIMTGLSTSGCVMRTALPATDLEYVVTVISDACADPQEQLHSTLVQTLLPSKTYVTAGQEF